MAAQEPMTWRTRLAVAAAIGVLCQWAVAEGTSTAQAPAVGARTLEPIAASPHAYFESLRARPEHYRSWSLRDQTELDHLTNFGTSRYFTYAPASDASTTPQDGAKFYKPADDRIGSDSDSIPGNQQLRMPVGLDGGTILITWDFWYGREFKQNIGRLANYKTFQLRQGNAGERTGRLFWTHMNRFRSELAADEISRVFESLSSAGLPLPPGILDREPLRPAGDEAIGGNVFAVKMATWTRYWMEVALSVPASDPRWLPWKALNSQAMTLSGTWHMLSLWMADEHTNPVRIIHRVPWATRGTHIASFDFEFNTSAAPQAQDGPLVGYGRNVAVLLNYQLPPRPESDARIFMRPAPGAYARR